MMTSSKLSTKQGISSDLSPALKRAKEINRPLPGPPLEGEGDIETIYIKR
jgi:hypothetical protein